MTSTPEDYRRRAKRLAVEAYRRLVRPDERSVTEPRRGRSWSGPGDGLLRRD